MPEFTEPPPLPNADRMIADYYRQRAEAWEAAYWAEMNRWRQLVFRTCLVGSITVIIVSLVAIVAMGAVA